MSKIQIAHGHCVEVDAEDIQKLQGIKWHFVGGKHRNGKGYAYTNIKNSAVSMHHFILGQPLKGMTIDHINGNGLDNRKENLRFASYQNQRQNSVMQKDNSTGFKGVIKARKGAYRVAICHKHIGTFKDKIEAAKAYNEAAIKLFGQFARLNEI